MWWHNNKHLLILVYESSMNLQYLTGYMFQILNHHHHHQRTGSAYFDTELKPTIADIYVRLLQTEVTSGPSCSKHH